MGSALNWQQVIFDVLSHVSVLNMVIKLEGYEIKKGFGFE